MQDDEYSGQPAVLDFPPEATAYQLTRHIPVGTYVMHQQPDGDSRFIFVSDRWLQMLNLSRDAVLADAGLAFGRIHWEERDAVITQISGTRATKRRFQWEGRVVDCGNMAWCSIESVPRPLPDGSTIWEGVLIDITARKKAEQGLKDQEAAMRRMLDGLPTPAAAMTLDQNRIIYVNRQYTETFGYTLVEVPNLSVWGDRAYPDPVYRDFVRSNWQQRIASVGADGWVQPMEVRVTCKDGQVRDIVAHAQFLDDMLLLSMLDITESKQMRARAESNARLAALGQMAAGLGHELNQPLAVMALAADNAVLALDALGPDGVAEARARLDSIATATERARDIIDNLRIIGRTDDGAEAPQPTDLHTVVHGALVLTRQALQAAGIDAELSLPPQAWAMARRVPLEQALLNLILNARDAIQQAGVTPGWIHIAAERQGDAMVITVADNGGGLSDACLARLFEPFFTTKPPTQGTGLGLPISRASIESMGGRLSGRNQGPGAVFTIALRTTDMVPGAPVAG